MTWTGKKRWVGSTGAVLIATLAIGGLYKFGPFHHAPEVSHSAVSAAALSAPDVRVGPAPAQTVPPRMPAAARPEEAELDAAARKQVVETLAQVLAEQYVYKERGEKMAEKIRTRLGEGAYDGMLSPIAFANALQADLQSIARDGHLGVRYEPAPASPAANAPAARQNAPEAAVPEVRILDGNIGYMAVNAMPPSEAARQAVAAAFALLRDTDALVIDLRGNAGGSPEMVGLIEGYLSEGPSYVTNVVHWRNDDRPEPLRTADVGKLSYGNDKPVYVLTSPATFSAAEQLSYDLQAFGRAVIVGQTTGGGSHTSNIGPVPLGHGFVANVPTGYLVNAITGTNWERVGVKPDVRVPAEEALEAAWSLAARNLAESAADPVTQVWLQLFSLAKLSGDASLDAAALAGEYKPLRGGGPAVPAIVTEKDGKLYMRMPAGSGTRDVALLSVGGDRYEPDGYPGGFSCTFVERNGKIMLLQAMSPGRLTVSEK